jgi:hypothetical protein
MQSFISCKDGQLLDASTFCTKVNESIKKELVIDESDENDNNMSEFWTTWGNKHSDHMPKTMKLSNGVQVVTYNVLNEKYLKYFDKEDKTNQGLSWCPFADPANTEDRQNINALVVKNWLTKNYIVMIQECSESFFMKLLKNIPEFLMMIEYHMTYVNNSITNFNLTMWRRDSYRLKSMDCLMPGILGKKGFVEEEHVSYYTLQKMNDPTIIFNLANVHVSWLTNQKFCDRYKEVFFNSPYPTIIGGDFNASSRLPLNIEGDHISIYDDPKIKLFLPDLSQPSSSAYSHVNCFKNAGSKSKMLDCYDHIMVIDPNSH